MPTEAKKNDFWDDDAKPVQASAEGFWDDDARPVSADMKGNASNVSLGDVVTESIPVIGPLAKKASLGTAALLRKATGKDQGMTVPEVYDKLKAQAAADLEAYEAANPKLAAGGSVLGGFMAPVPGGGIIAQGVKNAALQAADAYSRDKSLGEIGGQAAIAGGLGAATGVLGRGVSGLKKFRDERVTKAALGHGIKNFREMARTKGFEKFADDLREANEFTGGKPIVEFGDTTERIAEKAGMAKDKAWEKIESLYGEADEALKNRSVDLRLLAQSLTDKAAALPNLGVSRGTRQALTAEAEAIMEMARTQGRMIPLSEAQNLKNQYLFKMTDPRTHALGADGSAEIRSSINDVMKDALDRAQRSKALAETGKDLVGEWQHAMDKYGAYATAAKAGDDRALANVSNRFFSPSDHAIGGLVGIADAVKHGMAESNPLGSIVKGIGGAAVNKLVRERGPAAAGVTAEKIGPIMQKVVGTKYYQALSTAAKRGNASIAATHYILSQQDPEYRRLTEDGK